MDNLIKSLPAILKASGASEEVVEAACIAAWKHAVGEGLSGNAVAVQLVNQTLVVAVAAKPYIIFKRAQSQLGHCFTNREI